MTDSGEKLLDALKRDYSRCEITFERRMGWGFVLIGELNGERLLYIRAGSAKGACAKFREAYAKAEAGGMLK